VQLIELAISQSRKLARGLSPVDFHADGLRAALQEFAATTSELFGVNCFVTADRPVTFDDPAVASQVFRIAQEAVGNAVKHGRARRIEITLTCDADRLLLAVRDNGVGMPEALPDGDGMGLRIMSHRASVIGAQFDVRRGENGGTVVGCAVPLQQTDRQVKHA
jgi:signal transduction histidine kinase